LARRALIEDIKEDRKGWLQHGLAALAVSLLGLGVAGSVVLTGNAQHTEVAAPATRVAALATERTKADLPAAFDRDPAATSRDATRPELDQAKLQSLADQRAEELSKTDDRIEQAARSKAAAARDESLESTSVNTQQQGAVLARRELERQAAALARRELERQAAALARRELERTSRSTRTAPALPAAQRASRAAAAPRAEAPRAISNPPARAGRAGCMPVRGGYSVAARFGQVGAWSRYHTGYDFSGPVGTALQAPASGVVTNAGGGPASGWAGNYVAIRHSDGTSSLQAHMSTVSVSVGQSVSACQVVGAIGMTGRTFGPHVHFEIYPSGVTPGDVYRAVNPLSWLNARGVRP